MARLTWDDDEWGDPPLFVPQVADDGYEVTAEILGPDGEPLSQLLSRPFIPFGFSAGPREPEWWVRS